MPAIVACCEPAFYAGPSGRALRHAGTCNQAGQRVSDHEQLQPNEALRVWYDHPSDCRCRVCAWVEAHLDDLDDDGGFGEVPT